MEASPDVPTWQSLQGKKLSSSTVTFGMGGGLERLREGSRAVSGGIKSKRIYAGTGEIAELFGEKDGM